MKRILAALIAFVATSVVTAAVPAKGDKPPEPAVAYMPGTWIVQLRAAVNASDFLNELGVDPAAAVLFSLAFNGFSAELSQSQIATIAESPDVLSVEPDQVMSKESDQTTGPVSSNIPNSGNLPWGLDLIDQRSSTTDGHYLATSDGTGVRVYVLDTGVNAAHGDFGARVVDGWSYRATSALVTNALSLGSCKSNSNYSASAHPWDVDTFDQAVVTADKGKSDNEGHGTHVAGIIGGSLTGVAKNVTIVPVRILNSCGEGTTTMAIKGVEWVLSDHANNQKAVVNMSIGFLNRPCTFERVINGAFNASASDPTCRVQPATWLLGEGVPVIAAAGNDPALDPCGTAPAATPGTISVGAVGAGAAEASYSAFGECVDLFAPGGSGYVNGGVNSTWHYLSTDPSNSSPYMNEAGTSMASPHVAGAVALYMQNLTLPGDVSTVPQLAWSWLKQQSTCGIVTYYNSSRTVQTPNRFLNIGSTAVAPCAPTSITKTQESGRSTIAWSEVPSGNGSDVTGYQVTTTPATTGCTTGAATYTCALTGLVDGTRYTVSVQAINGVGAGTAGTLSLVAGTSGVETTTTTSTTTTVPVTTTTEAPTTTTTAVPVPSTTLPAVASTPSSPVTAVSSSKSLLLTWPAVASAEAVTYVVSVSPGGVSCTTSNTSCTFIGVSLGTVYNFSIVARTASGQASVALRYTVTAGINQRYTSVKKSSRTTLTAIVSSLSKGKRTYKVTSGKCKISTGRLVAPATTGVCKVKVSIAKYRTYKPMSTVLTIYVV